VSSKLNNDERVKLDNEINKQIKGIMIAVENYPNLKSNDRFKDITNSMTEIEDELQASRRTYNAAVIDYNNYLQMIPSNIVGKLSGYKVKTLFEAFEKERENINVKELFNS
jgi:LemA protein